MLEDDIQNNKLLLLGKLAASLAHELRNPLSAIKLNLDSINLCRDTLDQDILDSVSSCLEATERISNLIETTLSFSRKSNNASSVLSLNDLLYQAADMVSSEAKKKGVIVELKLKSGLPNIDINRSKTLQVLINLLTNAMEACENKGKVIVASSINKKKEMLVRIQDNGIGIKEEDKEKIFNEFYTSKSSGTGLGLCVCKTLVEEMGASLSFSSQEGKGTTFDITFPNKMTKAINET